MTLGMLAAKDITLWKKFLAIKMYEEDGDFDELMTGVRKMIEDNPYYYLELYQTNRYSVVEDSHEPLSIKSKVERMEEELSLQSISNSKIFYWIYLLCSIFLGFIIALVGLIMWHKSETAE